MTEVNMNRAVPLAEPSAELQRLRTYNTLLLGTLRELHDVQRTAQRTGQSGEQYAAYIACMKRVKKVIGEH